MPGQGKLNEDAVDVGIVVELIDEVEKLVLTDRGVEAKEGGLVADLCAGFDFCRDVGLAGAVVADENGGEVRNLFAFCL